MVAKYGKHVSRKATPQVHPIPGRETEQAKNYAGGYVFKLDKWKALDRFLILGVEGGTYYAGERKLTKEAGKVIGACLKEDATRTVRTIVEVSEAGRAVKNDPALFALALAASDEPLVRKEALQALPKVARIPTHLFHFVEYVSELRGWGRGLRKAVGDWYNDLPPEKLAYEVVKYQSRDKWSNRDMLRLAHVTPKSPAHNVIYRYVDVGWEEMERAREVRDKAGRVRLYGTTERLTLPAVIEGFEKAKKEAEPRVLAGLIRQYGLTREMVPTEALQSPEVWDALLEKMPLTAMIRNLNKMTQVELLAPMSEALKTVIERLHDAEYLKRSRIHPLSVLVALKTYGQGRGDKGKLTWTPVVAVSDALNDAFYAAFDNVEPIGGKTLIGLDVSGSMGSPISGLPLQVREAAAAMAMVTARVEGPENYLITGFCSSAKRGSAYGSFGWGGARDAITPLNISPKDKLETVLNKTEGLPFGGTDCALPALYAKDQNLPVDQILIYTDNETWAGEVHPTQALTKLRNHVGKPVKQVVVGMTATGFTIADPNDPLSLDVVGFDTVTPQAISEFLKEGR